MLEIERLTNSNAVLQKITNPDEDLIFDVGFFRLFNSDTGLPSDLYLVLNSANDANGETTIDTADEQEMETLISYAFRKGSISYERYAKGTAAAFGDALHVSSALIAKYTAYIESK